MNYLTLEVEIDHGKVAAKEPGLLPDKATGLLTLFQPHAYSDAVGDLFQSCRTPFRACRTVLGAERRSGGSHKLVSDRSQVFTPDFWTDSEPLGGATLRRPTRHVIAPSIRAGGERRERTFELQFAFPPVATRNGLTRLPG